MRVRGPRRCSTAASQWLERIGNRPRLPKGDVDRLEVKVAIDAVIVFGADAGARSETLFHRGQPVVGADRQQAAAAQGRGKSGISGYCTYRSEERRVGKECRSRW